MRDRASDAVGRDRNADRAHELGQEVNASADEIARLRARLSHVEARIEAAFMDGALWGSRHKPFSIDDMAKAARAYEQPYTPDREEPLHCDACGEPWPDPLEGAERSVVVPGETPDAWYFCSERCENEFMGGNVYDPLRGSHRWKDD